MSSILCFGSLFSFRVYCRLPTCSTCSDLSNWTIHVLCSSCFSFWWLLLSFFFRRFYFIACRRFDVFCWCAVFNVSGSTLLLSNGINGNRHWVTECEHEALSHSHSRFTSYTSPPSHVLLSIPKILFKIFNTTQVFGVYY